jgi:cation diffusion facilitator CzcD-associated flavoprotein CzcO
MTKSVMASLSRHDGAAGAAPSRLSASGIDASAYAIVEAPLGTPRPVRIICIGAGSSGINMIRSLRQTLPANSYEFTMYEKNENIGGTWFENRYPGCRCDTPSHNYQFSWRPNPHWSNFFAPAEEINAYLSKTAEDENMLPCIKTSHKVLGALWDEDAAIWRLNIKDLKSGTEFGDHAHFVIDAIGILK